MAITLALSVLPASAQTALDRVIADYKQQCVSAQANILPEIDADPDAPQTAVLEIGDDAIYEIKVTPEGEMATVVYTSFSCTNIGYAWCGMSGGCVSYLIVDEQVFEWAGGGRPMSVNAGKSTLIVSAIHGSGCTDGDGKDGWGAAPCYRVMVWEEDLRSFWSIQGDVTARPDFSVPQDNDQD